MASALVKIPQSQNSTGECPNCGLNVSFTLQHSRQIFPTLQQPGEFPSPPVGEVYVREFVRVCVHCNRTVVTIQGFCRIDAESNSNAVKVGEEERVWPPSEPRELPVTAPAEVRSLYAEGSRCESAQSYRGAAGMYRGAVERLCEDRGAAGKDLNQRINDLVNRGVTAEIVADLHEARLLGNWSLHDGLEFSAAEVADVAELIAEAVHVLYVEPAERARMRQARKDRRDQHKSSSTP
jgi:hypothetical protein